MHYCTSVCRALERHTRQQITKYCTSNKHTLILRQSGSWPQKAGVEHGASVPGVRGAALSPIQGGGDIRACLMEKGGPVETV